MAAQTPEVSVIVPTFNRVESLRRVIEGLLVQTFRDLEIIVVDDGSTDSTEGMVQGLMTGSPISMVYLKQANKGAGAARNLGLKRAGGDIVVFLDDDVVPAADLIEQHAVRHRQDTDVALAAVGCVVNSFEIVETPFVRWLMNDGPAFRQNRQPDGSLLDHWSLCTANLSMKRRLLLEERFFDETFRPFFEDIELAFRLKRHGLRIVVNRKAIGYHLRSETFDKYCRRSIQSGRSAALFYRKWPEARADASSSSGNRTAVLRSAERAIMSMMAPPLRRAVSWLDERGHGVPPIMYVLISGHYFEIGYRKALQGLAKT